MDQQFYRSLLLLVNTKDHMDLLHKYVAARIDHHRVLEIQGSIAELRRFKTLRDEVVKGAE